ncbi:MAG: helix-turn-helix domain-containing protein [Bacteroidetes bacterium]|nr:helix-turn-helix domain-containing protein [Bacteroidota bacterium]
MQINPTEENNAAALASKFINQTTRHIFLTGKAGTGKTTFLRYITAHTHKKAVIAAPTGIAAINAGGVTLHSLFQLPFGAFVPSKDKNSEVSNYQKINNPYSLIKDLQIRGNKRRLIQEIELLIIDEVSMLRADLLDAIDTVLRTIRRQQNVPFGGVQVLFIGDLLQLPPVVKDFEWQVLRNYYKSAHFFEAQALQQNKPLYIELEKIYRQSDDTFISVLNHLRDNKITKDDIDLLNKYYKPNFKSDSGENIIYLTTHNQKADRINGEELKNLKGNSFSYKAEVTGEFNEHAYPVEETLELKIGAQVMFIKNDLSGKQAYFNGKIGKISEIGKDAILVAFDDGSQNVLVEKYLWENKRFTINEITNEVEEKAVGKFLHYPIKLAWAITVHKSQGLTFKKAIIDVGAAFAPGQVYVALSRLTSLDGLVLTSPINYESITEDVAITQFSAIKNKPEALEELLETERGRYVKDFTISCFGFSHLLYHLQRHIDSYTKNEKKSAKQKFESFARDLRNEFEETKALADKFTNQLNNLFYAQPTDFDKVYERLKSAKAYFTPIIKGYNEKIQKHIERVKLEKKVKSYLNELLELDAMFFKILQMMERADALLNSTINKTELTKKDVLGEALKNGRLEQVEHVLEEILKPARKKSDPPKPKLPKGHSKIESLNLYKTGKSIEEIAKERSMSPVTIEGHLAECVGEGAINALDFVSQEKIGHIVTVSKKLETTLFGPIKQALGDEYTYSDIKFAMAHYGKEQEKTT